MKINRIKRENIYSIVLPGSFLVACFIILAKGSIFSGVYAFPLLNWVIRPFVDALPQLALLVAVFVSLYSLCATDQESIEIKLGKTAVLGYVIFTITSLVFSFVLSNLPYLFTRSGPTSIEPAVQALLDAVANVLTSISWIVIITVLSRRTFKANTNSWRVVDGVVVAGIILASAVSHGYISLLLQKNLENMMQNMMIGIASGSQWSMLSQLVSILFLWLLSYWMLRHVLLPKVDSERGIQEANATN